MGNYIKIFLTAIFLILCIVFGFRYGLSIKYQNDLKEIQETRNTVLDNYNDNRNLALSYINVYKIVDENTYQEVKNDIYINFSSELQKEYFPTANYSGLNLYSIDSEVIKCIGTDNGVNAKNTFLLEYNLKTINYDQNITNLIDIENGVITRVIRIK